MSMTITIETVDGACAVLFDGDHDPETLGDFVAALLAGEECSVQIPMPGAAADVPLWSSDVRRFDIRRD